MKKRKSDSQKIKNFFKKYYLAGIISWGIIALILGLLKIFQIYNLTNKTVLVIVLIPLAILSLPLIIVIAYTGMIINPDMGYQTLMQSTPGIITMAILAIIYYFFLGIFIKWVYDKIRY